jgi:hypothetical protein
LSGLLTDTEAFRRWFGDSRVVDAEGRPRVLYHGTGDDFTVVKPYPWDGPWSFHKCTHPKRKRYPRLRMVYLTSDPELASGFALAAGFVGKKEHQATLPLFVKASKLLVVEGTEGLAVREAELLGAQRYIHRLSGLWSSEESELRWAFYITAGGRGYDGVVFPGVHDHPGTLKTKSPSDIYAFFETASFKSALSNNGAFDPNDPDICR